MKIKLLCSTAALLVAGCSTITQTVKTPVSINTTNGPVIVMAEYENKITCWGNGKNVVDKTRISIGKTSSLGAAGVQQEQTLADVLSAIADLIKAAKPPVVP